MVLSTHLGYVGKIGSYIMLKKKDMLKQRGV